MLDRVAMLAARDRRCARDRLFAMMRQLRDPIDLADVAHIVLTEANLAAMVWCP